MDLHGKKVVLASKSPRRSELLAGLDIEFTVDPHYSFEEAYGPEVPHREVPVRMSEEKSRSYYRNLEENEILLTSDTMVLLDDRMMGKPRTREDAVNMLKALSGRTHEVLTAVTVRDCRHFETVTDSTLVHFRELTDEEINYYVDVYSPYDKAGAYGIQEWIGYAACTGIEGSFYNVMGLPVHKVYTLLKKFAEYE